MYTYYIMEDVSVYYPIQNLWRKSLLGVDLTSRLLGIRRGNDFFQSSASSLADVNSSPGSLFQERCLQIKLIKPLHCQFLFICFAPGGALP